MKKRKERAGFDLRMKIAFDDGGYEVPVDTPKAWVVELTPKEQRVLTSARGTDRRKLSSSRNFGPRRSPGHEGIPQTGTRGRAQIDDRGGC